MLTDKEYQAKLEAIQTSSAPADVKQAAIEKLRADQGMNRPMAMVENGDITDVSSSF
jgi:hypothetical protein